MAKPRYFSVVGTLGEYECYMLLRAGSRSLKELSGKYDFTPVGKPNGSRKYETVIVSPDVFKIKFKVGRKNRVSLTKNNPEGLELHLEEISDNKLAKEMSTLRNKRMMYDHFKSNMSGISQDQVRVGLVR